MGIRKLNLILPFFLVGLVMGCAHRETLKAHRQSSDLTALFPTESQIPGLLCPDTPKTVPSDQFPVYLGARYPRYAAYNLKSIWYRSYYNRSSPGAGPIVDMEVIYLGSSDDAFGVFSVERPRFDEETQIRSQGYITESMAGFWSGNLYIRILTPKEERSNRRWLTAVAEVVYRRLPPGPLLPAGFDRFPVELRIPYSEIFVRSRVLGYSFLTDGYLVDYDFGGRMVTAFVCPCVNPEVAGQRFRDFFEAVVAQKARVVPMAGLGDRAFLARGTRHGNIAIFKRGRYLAGLLAVPPVMGDFLKQFDQLLSNSH